MKRAQFLQQAVAFVFVVGDFARPKPKIETYDSGTYDAGTYG